MRVRPFALIIFLTLSFSGMAQPSEVNPYLQRQVDGTFVLSEAGASFFAQMALSCLQREYPNKLNQVLSDSSNLLEPHVLHPAFYGCFDWHSSVHGHWMLVRLLKQFPNLPEGPEIREKLATNLSAQNILAEVAYFTEASKSWERMYGWSWLMKLAQELYMWEDVEGQEWYQHLVPLVEAIRTRYFEFLPVQTYPVRTGVHPNTAFGMSYAWDYALSVGDEAFLKLLRTTAIRYYMDDRNCPAGWEPSGEDFLSACLEEANLMQKVLPSVAFQRWLSDFLPEEAWSSLLLPAEVSDRSDPKIVHLDGLNLSRAWCLYNIQSGLADAELAGRLIEAAGAHLEATLPNIASEHYEGSHWLASFAVYALSVNR